MSDEVVNETKEIKEEKVFYPYTVSIRFHNNSKSYTFGTELSDLEVGDSVVVETSQGVELGTCHTTSMSTEDYPVDINLKPVLRKALESDLKQYEENIELAKDALKICEEEVEKLGLGMHLLSSEYMLDRSKILFIYQAESRVDFRELLKKLGARLHCRIELRQIGERDKAKMVGGIGMCGMECCCSRFKTNLEVVSINMAKTQLLALNTEKLSGMCGKLMCCLRYENDDYKELTKDLPKMGAHVEYNDEIYKVTSMNVLTDEARIENHEHVETISLEELKKDAIVRKGVPLTKNGSSNSGRGKNMKSLNERMKEIKTNNQQEILQPQKEVEEKRERPSESNKPKKNRENKGNRRNQEGNKKKPTFQEKGLKKKTNNPNRKKQLARQNKPQANVTVRSFKSSKTKAMEKKAGDKK